MRITADGNLKLANPSSTKNLLIQDFEGKIDRIVLSGMEKQVLNGLGAFSNLDDISGWSLTSGNVTSTAIGYYGIGTSSPEEKLHVNGNIKGNCLLGSCLAVTGSGTFTGNLGIGTTDPHCQLDVDASIDRGGLCVTTNHTTPYHFGIRSTVNNDLTKGLSVVNSVEGRDKFYVYGNGETHVEGGLFSRTNSYLAIEDGNVGIGRSDATHKLDVIGGFRFQNNNGAGLTLSYNGNETILDSHGPFYINLDNGNPLYIGWGDPQSNVAIGGNLQLQGTETILGNLGIGGAAGTNSRMRLVTSGAQPVGFSVEEQGNADVLIQSIASDANTLAFAGGTSSGSPAFSVSGNGNIYSSGRIGVGTTTPQEKLHISGGSILLDGSVGSSNDHTHSSGDELWTTGHWSARIKTASGTAWQVVNPSNIGKYMGYGLTNSGYYWFSSNQLAHDHHSTDDVVRHMALEPASNGTSTLKVYGNILTREVTVSTTWSDYVFDKDYKLMSLSDVESYINKNHHLPGVPSATEVEGGNLKLGEMQAKHMEKIEELTLYIIELNKKIEDLEKRLQH